MKHVIDKLNCLMSEKNLFLVVHELINPYNFDARLTNETAESPAQISKFELEQKNPQFPEFS